MKDSSKSVRLVSDDGSVVTVTPNGMDTGQGVTLLVQPTDDRAASADAPATLPAVTARLDPETTEALLGAIYEAQGKRYRPGRSGTQVTD